MDHFNSGKAFKPGGNPTLLKPGISLRRREYPSDDGNINPVLKPRCGPGTDDVHTGVINLDQQ